MPQPYVHPRGEVCEMQEFNYIIVIVKRFSHAHQDNIGNSFGKIPFGREYLEQHFGRDKRSNEPVFCGGAEGAAHPASDLCRNAHRISVLVPHENAFHRFAVGQRVKVFYGAVDSRNELLHDRQSRDTGFFGKTCAECL